MLLEVGSSRAMYDIQIEVERVRCDDSGRALNAFPPEYINSSIQLRVTARATSWSMKTSRHWYNETNPLLGAEEDDCRR